METAPTCSDAHSCSRAGGVSADTVDLLVCAAVAYGVLSDAASEGSPTSVGVETRDELARLWSPPVTGVAVFDPGRVGGRPVVGVDPVQVVKSAHAYEAACGQDSGWMGSEAQLWMRRVGVAAMQLVSCASPASVFYLSQERDAVLALTVRRDGWHLHTHLASRPGRGRGRALRGTVLPVLLTAADQQAVTVHAVAADRRLAAAFITGVPGLRDVGPAFPRGRRLRWKPERPGSCGSPSRG